MSRMKRSEEAAARGRGASSSAGGTRPCEEWAGESWAETAEATQTVVTVAMATVAMEGTMTTHPSHGELEQPFELDGEAVGERRREQRCQRGRARGVTGS